MKALTIGLIAGPHRLRARRALESLVGQSVAGAMTVHVADFAPDAEPITADRPEVVTTEFSDPCLLGEARAEIVRQAVTPLVGFLEEHCVAEPGWAEALVKAHGDPGVAAAAGVITNLDSEPLLARVAALCSYRASLAPISSPEATILFGQNVCYKREDLLPLGSDLGYFLTAELLLFRRLLARGRRLRLVEGARFQHAGLTRFSQVLHGVFHYERSAHGFARQFGGRSSIIDYARAIASPIARTAKTGVTESQVRGFPLVTLGCLPFALGIHTVAAAGQIVGRLGGPGHSPAAYSSNELLTQRTALPPLEH